MIHRIKSWYSGTYEGRPSTFHFESAVCFRNWFLFALVGRKFTDFCRLYVIWIDVALRLCRQERKPTGSLRLKITVSIKAYTKNAKNILPFAFKANFFLSKYPWILSWLEKKVWVDFKKMVRVLYISTYLWFFASDMKIFFIMGFITFIASFINRKLSYYLNISLPLKSLTLFYFIDAIYHVFLVFQNYVFPMQNDEDELNKFS